MIITFINDWVLLDDESSARAAYKWMEKYVTPGEFDVITGYFTIGALAWLSKVLDSDIQRFRFILGEIVHQNRNSEEHALDLINENLTVESAFSLHKNARDAVNFLRQESVSAQTLGINP